MKLFIADKGADAWIILVQKSGKKIEDSYELKICGI